MIIRRIRNLIKYKDFKNKKEIIKILDKKLNFRKTNLVIIDPEGIIIFESESI